MFHTMDILYFVCAICHLIKTEGQQYKLRFMSIELIIKFKNKKYFF